MIMRRTILLTITALTLLAISGCYNYSNAQQPSRKIIRVALNKTTSMGSGTPGQPMTSFYTNVGVGTPPKPFKLLIDIDAMETWLPHYERSGFMLNLVGLSRLNYKNGYSKKDSESSVKEDEKFSIVYGGCELTGKPYEDLYEFYNVTESWNQVLFRHRFLAISSASNDKLSALGIDGVLSFSPSSISDSGSISTLANLYSAKLIEDMRLSLWLNSDSDTNDGGEMTLGGVNPARYLRKIEYHNLANSVSNRWAVNLQNVRLGGEIVSCEQGDCTAVLSTGTNDFYGPMMDVFEIRKLLGVSSIACKDDICEIDCLKALPHLIFNIGGRPYIVPPVSYIRKHANGFVDRILKPPTCYVSIFPNKDQEKQWILGTNFLSNFYTVFDSSKRQVGFATKK